MPPQPSQDLHYQIWSWAQQVNQYTQQYNQQSLPFESISRTTANGMRLRDRPARNPLAEIPINPHCRKRKVEKAMPDKEDVRAGDTAEPVKKRRGRPPGSRNKSHGQGSNKPDSVLSRGRPPSIPNLPPPSASSAKTPSSRKSSSPSKSKRGDRTLEQPRPDATVDMPFLETCKPAVFKTSFRELKAAGKPIPDAILEVRQKLLYVPKGLIPRELKAQYDKDNDTPRKSNDPLPDSEYQDPAETPFTKQQLERLKHTVDEICRKASTAARIKANQGARKTVGYYYDADPARG
ncbi:MAG: hypothetical protein L6R42_005979 [Xanthoria sp. 1 TBL-2021]|nr:MAG: hypothetical protein L6R42_005979 [Xanthoria sp. 1 TBL-2021]